MKALASTIKPPFFIAMALVVLLSVACESGNNIIIEKIPKSRVIVLTDMLNEPDDSQTMVRLLMYANEMDIEGLIAVSLCHQYLGKKDVLSVLKAGKIISVDTVVQERNGVHPQEIIKRINAYGKVLENLKEHESGWPSEAYLLSKVGSGPAGYGMSDVGVGKTTSGSKLIEEAILKEDVRPLYICINAGANTLAQTLVDLQTKLSPEKLGEAIKRIRVYDDAGQDDAGAWIANTFPDLHYQRSQKQVFNFMNNDGPAVWDVADYPGKGQHLWAKRNVQMNHGPLGELYPNRMKWRRPDLYNTLEGGGTSTWIGHVNRGLCVPEEITWGGWGGRFTDQKVKNVLADQLKWADLVETEDEYKPFFMYTETSDEWTDPNKKITYDDKGTPIYRWRQAYQNDFEARMDWCLNPFENANHNPVAAFGDDTSDGIVFYTVKAGEEITLDATKSTDPDGDELLLRWFVYPEVGSYKGPIDFKTAENAKTTLVVPKEAQAQSFHVILEVRDTDSNVPLYDYKRIVFQVEKSEKI